ncbi:hypothetical protein P154DRAFT_128757 [Amniculicola lignicola CBS 123094]|uniref:Uncharacterized protein n=1 Tax=Amniculicola lignicola CBS 123094 TaxID=1392246 RepID=A0A6A5W5H8_9PLEO|nr:hypothetical protein P154DRAFT_128757 [Amniculicola lignicola CBS 123094]
MSPISLDFFLLCWARSAKTRLLSRHNVSIYYAGIVLLYALNCEMSLLRSMQCAAQVFSSSRRRFLISLLLLPQYVLFAVWHLSLVLVCEILSSDPATQAGIQFIFNLWFARSHRQHHIQIASCR